MANEHPKIEDDVSQFSGQISQRFVTWVTDVKLREAHHNDETKPRLWPRLYRRGLLGQLKQIVKTVLGQGDLANIRKKVGKKRIQGQGRHAAQRQREKKASAHKCLHERRIH